MNAVLVSAISRETGASEEEVVDYMGVADENISLEMFVECMRKFRDLKDDHE